MDVTFTLDGNNKAKLQQACSILVGVTSGNVPKAVRVNSSGHVLTADAGTGGQSLPEYDATTVENYGSTNNVRYVRYRLGGVAGDIVATKEIFYAGGGAADNDVFTGSETTIP